MESWRIPTPAPARIAASCPIPLIAGYAPQGWSPGRAFLRRQKRNRLAHKKRPAPPLMDMDPLSWSRHFRNMPGEGDLDVVGFMRAVAATGYDGTLSLEIFNDRFRGGSSLIFALPSPTCPSGSPSTVSNAACPRFPEGRTAHRQGGRSLAPMRGQHQTVAGDMTRTATLLLGRPGTLQRSSAHRNVTSESGRSSRGPPG